MVGHGGTPVPRELLHPGMWVADVVYRPLETELLRDARAAGCRTLDGGGMVVLQAAGSLALFTEREPDPERMLRHFRTLGMKRSIATVCLSGCLEDKLEAAAAAGFDAIELFENDLIGSRLRPARGTRALRVSWASRSRSISRSATSRACRSRTSAAPRRSST